MAAQPFVVVLTKQNDPQLKILEGIPHTVGRNAEELRQAAQDAAVILHWSGPRAELRSVYLEAPRVRWVHSRNAGLDNTLFPELVESDVPLTNGTGVFSQSLGEFALAMVLYFAKDFPRTLRNQRSGRWEEFDVDEIAGQTMGIVGYGDIGRACARRAHAMDMKVLALKRHPPEKPDPLIEQFYQAQHLQEMLGRCDYVVVAAPLTQETHHMISDRQFAAMKRSAVLINVGRGPVVDQAALVRALQTGMIRGAGLDVFEKEPLPEGDPLWKMDNVFISPHSADHTRDWLDQAMRFFLRQYERFTKGEPLRNVVNKKLGY